MCHACGEDVFLSGLLKLKLSVEIEVCGAHSLSFAPHCFMNVSTSVTSVCFSVPNEAAKRV